MLKINYNKSFRTKGTNRIPLIYLIAGATPTLANAQPRISASGLKTATKTSYGEGKSAGTVTSLLASKVLNGHVSPFTVHKSKTKGVLIGSGIHDHKKQ